MEEVWRRHQHVVRGLSASRCVPSVHQSQQHEFSPHSAGAARMHSRSVSSLPHGFVTNGVAPPPASADASWGTPPQGAEKSSRPRRYANIINARSPGATASRPAARHVRSKSNPLDWLPPSPAARTPALAPEVNYLDVAHMKLYDRVSKPAPLHKFPTARSGYL